MAEGNEFGIDGLSDFRQIGSGGFSSVYAAWDSGFERWVAVKVLYNLDDSGRRRFDRERVIMGRLSQHRDVVTPFRSGYTNNRAPYLVMEYIGGGSLSGAIAARGQLPWREVIKYLVPVTDALSFAHGEGILHRDIKPDNILLGHGGAKLADFGIAAIREATATSVAFTLAHSPPETFVGGSDARDERSDIYSIFSTLYTALVGRAPFEVDGPDSQPAYMVRIADRPPPAVPADLAPTVVVDLVQRGLSKDPDHRPQSAAELRAELIELERSRTATGGPAPAPDDGRPSGGTIQVPGWEPPSPRSSADRSSGEPAPSVGSQSGEPAPSVGSQSGEPAPRFVQPSEAASFEPPTSWAPTPGTAPPMASPTPADAPSTGASRSDARPFPVPPAPAEGVGRRRAPAIAALLAVLAVVAAGVVIAARSLSGDPEPAGGDEVTEAAGSEASAGDDGGASGDSGGGDVSPGSQADRPSVAAGSGGNLRLLQWQAPDVANPYAAGGTKDVLAGSLVLEALAEWGPDGALLPVLAAEIPSVDNGGISGDLTEVTWTLRDDVLWSDGSPFTAADVQFTWEYCAGLSEECAADVFNEVTSVVAVDDRTVSITFDEPTPFPFVPFVGASSPVLQRSQFQDCASAGTCAEHDLRPIGTGPYVVTGLAPGDRVDYELNPSYRLLEQGKPSFGTVEIIGGGDAESAARSVLEIGDADYAWNMQVAPDTLLELEAAGQGRLELAFASNVEHLNLNQTNPDGDSPSDYANGTNPNPFFYRNPALARALSLAIDRFEVVATSYGPLGAPACNMWHLPSQRTTNNDWCLQQDIAEANRILDEELGYLDADGDGVRELPDGTPLEFELVTSTNAVRQANQELIRAYWAEIGVRTNVRHEDAFDFFTATDVSIWQFRTDIQMFTNGSVGPDAQSYLAGWTSAQIPTPDNNWIGGNIVRLADDEFDALHAELTTIPLTDPARDNLIIRLDDILSSESGSTIPLVLRANVSAFASDLDGVGPLNGWDSEYYNIEDWYRTP